MPSASGVADVFAWQNGGTVQAITSDGTVAWTADVSQAGCNGCLLPDFQGGLIVDSSDGSQESIYKLDGLTGQPYPAYTVDAHSYVAAQIAIHPDGTIFAHISNYVDGDSVVGIDPTTGAEKFRVSLPARINSNADIMIAGDGYAYLPYGYTVPSAAPHLKLLRVSSNGTNSIFDIDDSTGGEDAFPVTYYSTPALISNSDDGVFLSWQDGTGGYHWTSVSSTAFVDYTGPRIPGQETDSVAPVLQRQDGSFVGFALVGDRLAPFFTLTPYMVAFDASGNVLWSVANEQPFIATGDNGVIGTSGLTYDQNGNATGQGLIKADIKFAQNGIVTGQSITTLSWFGNAYQIGSIDQFLVTPIYLATTWTALQYGNQSGNGKSIKEDWFPPLQHCTTTPGCIGPHEAIYNALSDLVIRLSDSTLSGIAQTAVFNKLGTDSMGNQLTTQSFITYLTKHKPTFYDGLRSNFCWEALRSVVVNTLCSRWHIINIFLGSVADYFGDPAHPRQAISATPNNPLVIFFNPSEILYDNVGNNLGNEALIFHEALHGITGKFDSELEGLLPPPSGSICGITPYLQNNVLAFSPG